ncbi:hypothetical protein [Streptomyces sp. YGL11-2]|uniref:hypothetical protein n=1 Tax=Streptomyces sp. YGL11-2 TaxID=3414028 RepID=UPI003CFAC690
MTQAPLFTDSSCYHAAFATLLHTAEPHTDPFRVLGNSAATSARLGDDNLLSFSDPLEPLTETFRRHGYSLVQHPVRSKDDWAKAAQALQTGRAIAIAADAYFLEHYWVGHGTSHALHVVVLNDFDKTTETVRLTDPGKVVFFNDRVPLEKLTPAMCEGDAGQSWIELVPIPGHSPAAVGHRANLLALAQDLSGTSQEAGGWLSGTELTHTLSTNLDTFLDLVGNRPRGSEGAQQDWGPGPWLLLGLWWYHHTLRWLSGHLGTLAADGSLQNGTQLVDAVERASRDLLVVRNLIMRLGVMTADDPRSITFRNQLRPRLALAAQNLETAGTALAALAEENR